MKKFIRMMLLLLLMACHQVMAQYHPLFPIGEIAKNTDDYTGTIWLNELSVPDSNFKCSITQAVYAPGSHLNWHIHPGGQILLITEGMGYYQEKGKPVQLVRKGDVIVSQPNVAHWHGATPDSPFAYVAITPSERGRTIWLQKLTDDEYLHIHIVPAQADSNASRHSIFAKGMVAPNTDDYTGTVWLNLLSMQDSLFPFSLIRAEFAPGSRLRWHMHPKGQILLILEGTGYYMEKDTTGKVFLARVVHQGDVIKCAPGVVHTHMAAPHSSFAYIGIESDGVRWLQPVTDEEYNEISQE